MAHKERHTASKKKGGAVKILLAVVLLLVLAAGAAVLGNTSAPIGGDNTNCVIAGHRGWKGADYFRHIDRLAVGDSVTLTNLWETLTYTVADIQIIQPHEVDKIKIQQGRDLLTLLTCHPYASGGRQRYVVYCEKLPTMS